MIWFLHDRGVTAALHYLNEFPVMGPPGQDTCRQALDTTLALCTELEFPVAPKKTKWPASSLTFLGIEIDTDQQQPRLTEDKLHWLTTI